MPNAGTLVPDGRFAALFVGPSGSGKTPAACSFQTPDTDKRVWNWDFDGRIRGLLGCPWINRNRVTYDYFPPMHNTKQTFVRINEFCEILESTIKLNQNPYETVVLDSVTGLCNALICDAIPIVHSSENKGSKGRKLGAVNMPGMQEYGYEAMGLDQVMSFLRSIPIQNFIATAHIIDKYGKEKDANGKDDPYSQTIVVGESLVNGKARYTVEFRGDLARTTFHGLPDKLDITGLNFYTTIMGYLK
jgi:hypothetical protein